MYLRIFTFLAVLVVSLPCQAASMDFERWLEEVKKEAVAERGVTEETLDQAFRHVKLIERVVELDRKQPEFTLTLHKYLSGAVSDSRVSRAKQQLQENAKLFRALDQEYKVDPRIIVSLWGIETNFGTTTGSFSVIDALTTLAYDGRRSAYFRKELMNALVILDQGHIKAGDMKGSWAGAMGQNQFMPSSFLNFAEDYNKDGHKNIWTDRGDALASIANYLRKSGWKKDGKIALQVKAPETIDMSLVENKKQLSLQAWQSMGVRQMDGSALPVAFDRAWLVLPDGKTGTAYLAFHNFEVILKWNRANFFAIAAATLSDQLRVTEENILLSR